MVGYMAIGNINIGDQQQDVHKKVCNFFKALEI